MITKDNIKQVLISEKFGFFARHGVLSKHFGSTDEGFDLEYNFESGEFLYPEGVDTGRNTTIDDHQNESFVVFLCVAQLFERGYLPHQLKLEGKNYKGADAGYCDILVSKNNGTPYLIIECKTASVDKKEDEFRKHWVKTMRDGDQLFRYFNTYRRAEYLCMYAADYPEYTKNGVKEHRFENIYHLISLVDNDEYLKSNNKLHSFEEMRAHQGGSEEFFKVWKDTYKQDYNTRGLLEEGIAAMEIGKKNYSIFDLQTIDEYSLDKKYNEFALILRKHTISSHENAFDKLVNLFLAKIIDERYNAHELHLLWKGAANDDYFSLQDRLINLYKRGMKEFFDDEVASVENTEIDNAFKFLTAKADEARDTIKKYFRKLKYFNNNPFAFLDVHNEQLFYKNAVILKDTISMLQDIYLTKNTDNQFLGDLFEGFLNRGVHQSEGQFFTPIPIVRFLVSSLPLRQIIEGGEIPKAIDYACGAGHFLTEYARQIKPIVEEMAHLENIHDKQAREERLSTILREYYEQIVGIEKDYRLSKVSQVAAFMYGMDGIRIHYADGLEEIPGVQDHTYSVLVANPPYSVSGFLETLPEEERERYTLTQYVSNIEKNNSIETFFIERAAQLLKSGGVAAIVLPSSVLTGMGLYMYTRELLLKYFDIVAISSFGKNTFGQTNTSTVTLFLRRKDLEPDLSKHLDNRISEWFNGNMTDNDSYKDTDKLKAYIKHVGYKHDDYIALLKGELTDGFLVTEMGQEYIKALNFNKRGKNSTSTALAIGARKIRNEAQKFAKSKIYEELTPAGKALEERRYTLKFIREIEKEKLYYYMLAASNPQPVLVVQSPSDKTQEKKFLGYEWSNRKGDEGIHYLNTGKIKESSSDDESADDDTIQQVKGVNGIYTPLFNPLNLYDDSKINSLIRQNYNKEEIHINEDMGKFVSKGSLIDMMDFARVFLSKEIKMSFSNKQNYFDNERYEMKSLGTIADFIQRGKNPVYGESGMQVIKSGQARGGIDFDFSKTYYATNYSSDDKRLLKKGDILINSTGVGTAGRVTLFDLDGDYVVDNHVTIFRTIENVDNLYVFYTLAYGIGFKNIEAMANGTSGQIELSVSTIENIKIPVPPIDIQKKISEECGKIEDESHTKMHKVNELGNKIANLFDDVIGKLQKVEKLCSVINPSKSDIKSLDGSTLVSFVEMSSVSNDGYIEQKIDRPLAEVRKGSYTYFAEGDIIIAKITPCMENGKCALATGLTNGIGFGSSEFHVLRANGKLINNVYLFAYLNRKEIRDRAAAVMTGSSGHRRVPISFYEDLEIPVPSMDEQNKIAEEYLKLSAEIKSMRDYVESAPSRKQAILDKYLK